MTATAAGVEVQLGARNLDELLRQLSDDQVAERLANQDPTLWGPDAQAEAAIRLGWVDLPETSRPLLAEIEALRADLRSEGIDHVVLCGMGGSSLAPEVITASAGVELTVLDSTDPPVIQRAIRDRLEQTVVVVSSKSGTTVETDSHRRAYLRAFADAGIDGPSRMVVVTDPGSPLAELAETEGYRKVFLADPNVGGRYSALTAFGLVPAGLAGADIAELLDEAAALRATFTSGDAESKPHLGMLLGSALGASHEDGREKIALGQGATQTKGFAAWAEQLIAESSGKDNRGLLPVDVGGTTRSTPGWADGTYDDTVTRVAIGPPGDTGEDYLMTDGPLGGLFLLWETAVAIAGRLIGIDPFNQPNVEEAKKAARALLDEPGDDGSAGAGSVGSTTQRGPAFVDGAVEIHAAAELLGEASTVADALDAWSRAVPARGYLAVLAYLDHEQDARIAGVREVLAERTGLATTFGWGPRFLHSTGQYHKGGHPNGGFLQITATPPVDVDVPDRPYSFGRLIAAQAAGDLAVLDGKGFPVLRLHLTDRAAGVAEILHAAGRVSPT